MQTIKKTTTVLAGVALSAGLLGGFSAPANAAPQATQETASDVHTEQISDTQSKVTSEKVSFFAEDGKAKMKDNATGEVSDLPEYKTGDNGEKIYLAYQINEDGSLLVAGLSQAQPASANTYAAGDPSGDLKCWGSVFGNAGSDALGGAALGAAAGPEGAAGGAVIGSVVGGVKGAQDC